MLYIGGFFPYDQHVQQKLDERKHMILPERCTATKDLKTSQIMIGFAAAAALRMICDDLVSTCFAFSLKKSISPSLTFPLSVSTTHRLQYCIATYISIYPHVIRSSLGALLYLGCSQLVAKDMFQEVKLEKYFNIRLVEIFS